MGVIPTPTNFKTLTFDGENSRSYGVYITGEGVFNAPERNVEMVEIPGRNGAFALDKGNFNNIEVTYPAGIFADTEADFAQAVSDFRNFLCSKVGYVRLEDDYNPNEYRLAIYKSGLEVDHDLLIAGEFDLVFDCKPQRYLKSGETPITIGEWGETTTYTGEIAQFENPNGYLAVKSLVADITPLQDLHGYDKPWVGGAGKNKLPDTRIQGDTTISGVTFTTNSDGSVTMNGTATSTICYDMIRRNSPFVLPQGEYIVSGLTGSTAMIVIGNAESNIGIGNTNNLQTFTVSESTNVFAFIQISNGTTLNNITAYPMIRLASVTDATYAPWENICPITGFTGCEVDVAGVNLIKVSADSYDNSQACTSSITDSGVTVTATGNYARRMDAFNVVVGQTYTLSFKGKSTGNNNNVYFCKSANWNDRYGLQTLTATGTEYTYTFTATTSVFAIGFYVTSNSSSGEMTITDLQLELGSTATDYVPYNHNSAVYSVTWQTEAGTVYGGKLHIAIVNGEPKTWIVVDRVEESYEWSNGAGATTLGDYTRKVFKTTYASVRQYSGDNIQICNCLPWRHNYAEQSEHFYVDTGNAGSNNCVVFMPNSVTSQTLNIVYGLATPTTYQLDPVQVACLLGRNNVWNNVGDTSIEVGNDPNYAINPTRFDAQPLLEVTGFGDIDISGQAIAVHDVYVGDVVLASAFSVNNDTAILPIDTSAGNVGDSLTVNEFKFEITQSYPEGIIGNPTCTASEGVASVKKTTTKTVSFTLTVPKIEFAVQSYDIKTITFSFTVVSNYGTFVNHGTFNVYYDEYNGERIRFFISGGEFFGTTSKKTSILSIILNSTKSSLGQPMYIDLEIGEAYNIVSGEIVSVNNAIQIPAELPVLSSGANEITYDNTITQLDIVPRWWRV